ncbi:MAG TPA: cupredoxin domain-containing protein [Candidatus Binatia bacterium]|nr:cupredoxin domain-containing protein [Candidatus Binatia bacterium]
MSKGMFLAAIAVLVIGCAREPQQHAGTTMQFAITVTDTGFAPATITVPSGKPVTLVVTRTTDQTCAKEIVFPDQKIRKPLPLNEAVEITLPASPKGEIAYKCGMDMLSGKVVVR